MDNSTGVFQFHIRGEKASADVKFSVAGNKVIADCTCDGYSINKLCWHQSYVLTGKSGRLPSTERPLQKEFLKVVTAMSEGRRLIHKASVLYGEKETCRRCGKTDVVELKKGFMGRFIRLFVPSTRKYFCMSCRWSW